VYLADRSRTIGGTPAVLALDPNRRNLRDLAAYFEIALTRLGITLMLGNEVTADELVDFAPDAVVVATGGRVEMSDVPGVDGPDAVHALDVLRGEAVGERVVVVGGLEKHLGPPTIAEFLADQGRDVELLSEQLDFASGVEDATRFPLYERLRRKRVRISALHKLTRVEGGSVYVTDTATGVERRIPEATVVLASTLVPDDRLARSLEGRIPELHVVGDALAPRRIMHATLEGARAAHAI
jgi:thioredoxin reductase